MTNTVKIFSSSSWVSSRDPYRLSSKSSPYIERVLSRAVDTSLKRNRVKDQKNSLLKVVKMQF